MADEVKHYQVNGRYRMVIERAASTKGTDGFKVEANADTLAEVEADIDRLYNSAKVLTKAPEVKA